MKTVRVMMMSMALSAACSMATPVFATPPDHAPAHGYRAKQQYIYYPQREIYYAPDRRVWFWLEGRDWRVGAALPGPYQQFTSGGISIELGSDRPYTEHAYVVEHYGKGRKHKKPKKYKE